MLTDEQKQSDPIDSDCSQLVGVGRGSANGAQQIERCKRLNKFGRKRKCDEFEHEIEMDSTIVRGSDVQNC
jgi:hypothetical protein